ncbi:hypothetical protein [Ruegeria sp. Ofav3-42]|uniref:hypothetical protein n=1 Tax=Ruegeria sp. Ofav3-42 TaxID=2917759 RepID=UPI001EF73A77|nr:hypothetical protein [Ruegeria sp. Ofav3-42]MCG7521734.1 hypothetical protein [Ruegeria sp. Ofav3-42]
MKGFVVLAAAISVLTVALTGAATAQNRQCIFDGEVYEDGARVGPYVCDDGEWIISE